MRSIILCEGFDEILIIGYYLYKTKGWLYQKDGSFSQLYSFPKLHKRNQLIEVYKKNNDLLAIWCVGGKDSFELAFKFIKKTNFNHPEEGITDVFILTDRDRCEIEECILNIEKKMNDADLQVKELHNNDINSFTYEEEGEQYKLNIYPVVLPFDKQGALETVLLDAIAESGEEDHFIVENAKKYVDDLINGGKIQKYLQHERLRLKAEFSSAISITNPDRSTSLFDMLLTTHSWEEKDIVKKHFNMFDKYL